MKTLHLTNAWKETSGGNATLYRALPRESERRGQPIRLIVPSDKDRRGAKSRAAQETAAQFSVERTAGAFLDLYETIDPLREAEWR